MTPALLQGLTKATAVSISLTANGTARILFNGLANGNVAGGAAPAPISVDPDSEITFAVESTGPGAAVLEWNAWPVDKLLPGPVLPLGTLFPFDASDATGQPAAAALPYVPPANGTWSGPARIEFKLDTSGVLKWEDRGVSSAFSLRSLANANPVGIHVALRQPAPSSGAIVVTHRRSGVVVNTVRITL